MLSMIFVKNIDGLLAVQSARVVHYKGNGMKRYIRKLLEK
jgi:hypothetical protein